MKRDGKLTDIQLIVKQSDRQKNKIWKFTGVNPLTLFVLVLGLVSCAAPKPTPTPSVEITPSPTPTPTPTPTIKPSPKPKPKPSAVAPRSETDAPQSADSGGDAEPEYTSKNKASAPEKPQQAVSKPAPAIEPEIPPQPRAEDPVPPIQMAPIVPEQDSDPAPPPARQ